MRQFLHMEDTMNKCVEARRDPKCSQQRLAEITGEHDLSDVIRFIDEEDERRQKMPHGDDNYIN